MGGLLTACDGRYVTSKNFEETMMGVIMPTLIHRILSELRSQVCLGENSTGMGDPLGSPHVAPLLIFILFFISRIFFIIFMLQMAYNGRYIISTNFEEIMMDPIMPALMHRNLSELRSQACLGESCTGLGASLESPRVASFLVFIYFIFNSTFFSIIFIGISFFPHS